MAGTEKAKIVQVPEENTLDLDAAMKAGMRRFDGELYDAARDETRESQGHLPEQEEEEAQGEAAGLKAEEEEEAPGSKLKAEEEEEAPGSKLKAEEEEKPKTRFTSHEEAEKGYKSVLGEKTRLEQKNKDLQDKLEKIESEEAARAADEELGKTVKERSKELHKVALDTIDSLDPEDFEDNAAYQDRIAEVWAEKDSEFIRLMIPQIQTPGPEETGGSKPKAEGPEETGDSTPNVNEAWETAKKIAADQGIDSGDNYFLLVSQQAPETDDAGEAMSFEDQVNWAVEETKAYHAKTEDLIRERDKSAAKKKNLEYQQTHEHLGRSTATEAGQSAGRPVKKSVSLNDAVIHARESRRL